MKKTIGFFFNADNIFSRIICSLAYIVIYDMAFSDFVFKLFHYMGIDYIPIPATTYMVWAVISVFPILFYKGVKVLSSFFTILLYIMVYIPFIHAIFTMWGIDTFTKYTYSLLMAFLFSLYFSIGTKNTIFKNIIITPQIPFKWIELFTIVLTAVLVISNLGSMHLVNVFTQSDLMYELRAQNAEEAAGGASILAYIKGSLFGAFYPFLLINYLGEKKWLKTILITAAYFLLFMIDMQKLTFFMPFALIALCLFIKRQGKAFSMRLHSTVMYLFSVASIAILNIKDEVIQLGAGFIIILRTTAVAGWLTQYYLRFFSVNDNPYTLYSHINIINLLTDYYPYASSLGETVAYGSQNANANFLLTDGVAAAGIFGLLLIGLVFYFLLHILNSISYRYRLSDLLVIFLPTLSYVMNTSLFTTLLSNGLLILILLIGCTENPIDIRVNSNKDEE
ncbi:MAG: hypothetical protein ACTTHE_02765 [Prevotella multiformis]|uniref:hypothetical protein n=1 Tax=Prevotella multiformis TaxID=282402 RepID=UPI003FA0A290